MTNPIEEYKNNESEIEEIIEKIGEDEKINASEKEASNIDKLIDLVKSEGVELFHDQFKKPFAILRGSKNKVLRLNSREFKTWLSHIAREKIKINASTNAITTVINVLGGEACFKGDLHELSARVAWHKESIWYDLGDGNAVCINKEGWKIIENPPIIFYQFPHQKVQSHPQKGGNLSDILKFFNLRDKEDQLLLEIMIVTSFIPGFPHPISGVYGPQGSAKSMFHRLLKRLIDPSALEIISTPSNLRELIQTASHHWVLFLDNLSHIPSWLSDTLCRMCTGDGFSKRELYTDDDDIIYSFRLILGFNGINLAASKPDLLDRSILLALERISDSERKNEEVVLGEFEKIKPFILGAVFDILVKTLHEKEKVAPTKLSRMADFFCWGCAVSRAMGHDEKKFIDVYGANIRKQHDEAIEANPVAMAIMEFMEDKDFWEDSPTILFKELGRVGSNLSVDTTHWSWPRSPQTLWSKITVVKINLHSKGIHINKGKSGDRKITLQKVKQKNAQSVQSAQKETKNSNQLDAQDTPDTYLAQSNYCNTCKKKWSKDPNCPHSFDSDKLWDLKSKSKRMEFTLDGKTLFYDESGKIIGWHKENQ